MEATRSSETSVCNKRTRRHVPENGILHSRRHKNMKSYSHDPFVDYREPFVCLFVCLAGRRARILVATAWLLSFCFSVPIAIFYEEKKIQGTARHSVEQHRQLTQHCWSQESAAYGPR
jgi:hypothetical protein